MTPYDAEIRRLRNSKVHDWDDDYRRLLAKAEGYRAALSGDEVKALLAAAREASQVIHQLHGQQFHINVGIGICEWKPCVALRAAIAAYEGGKP